MLKNLAWDYFACLKTKTPHIDTVMNANAGPVLKNKVKYTGLGVFKIL